MKKLNSQAIKMDMFHAQVIFKSIVEDLIIIVKMIVWVEEGVWKISSANAMMVSQVRTVVIELI